MVLSYRVVPLTDERGSGPDPDSAEGGMYMTARALLDRIREILGIDITEASDAVNDTFLKSNGESGVESYHVPDSVYVRFYLTYAGAEDA